MSLRHLVPLPEDAFGSNDVLPEPNIEVDSCTSPCD